MTLLPAPDPASQKWPNLVWKRATMGEPTGSLISRRTPPHTHSSYRSEKEQHTHMNGWSHTWICHQCFSSPPYITYSKSSISSSTHTQNQGPPSLPVWSILPSHMSSPQPEKVFWQLLVIGDINSLLPFSHTRRNEWRMRTELIYKSGNNRDPNTQQLNTISSTETL